MSLAGVVESVSRAPRERGRVRSRAVAGSRHGNRARGGPRASRTSRRHRAPPSARGRRVGRRSGTSGASRSPSVGGGLGRRVAPPVGVGSIAGRVVGRVCGTSGAPASSVAGMRPGICGEVAFGRPAASSVPDVCPSRVAVDVWSVGVRVVVSVVSVVSSGVVIGLGWGRWASGYRCVCASVRAVSAYGY